ncbi:MAG: hypothetical protein IJN96_02410 [Clostridia bacterium]|nr:hypothetical protein [Clostridia bacterium]
MRKIGTVRAERIHIIEMMRRSVSGSLKKIIPNTVGAIIDPDADTILIREMETQEYAIY